jgi:DHA1 family bicyclomycin/chloramphenicol resistance-like MFS transporter
LSEVKRPSAALICAIAALPQLGVALTLPSLPTLRVALGAPVEMIQLTISAYFACLAATQLAYGGLSDRFGRRPFLLGSLALFSLAGAACALTSSLPALIALRALQGVGAAGCMVLTRAVIGDAWQGAGAVRMMSVAFTAPATVSLLGPLAGGWLLEGLGWRGVFATIAAIALAWGVWALRALPETRPAALRDRSAAATLSLTGACALFLRTPASVVFAAIMAFASAGIYAYSSVSAFVLIEVFGVPRQHYGWFLALTGTAMVGGSWSGGRLPAASRRKWLTAGSIVALVAALGVLAATHAPWRGAAGIVAIMVPMTVYGFCIGLVSPSAAVGAFQQVPRIAGTASALTGTLTMGAGALFVWIGGRLYDGTPAALGVCVALAAAAWIPLYLGIARRWH